MTLNGSRRHVDEQRNVPAQRKRGDVWCRFGRYYNISYILLLSIFKTQNYSIVGRLSRMLLWLARNWFKHISLLVMRFTCSREQQWFTYQMLLWYAGCDPQTIEFFKHSNSRWYSTWVWYKSWSGFSLGMHKCSTAFAREHWTRKTRVLSGGNRGGCNHSTWNLVKSEVHRSAKSSAPVDWLTKSFSQLNWPAAGCTSRFIIFNVKRKAF